MVLPVLLTLVLYVLVFGLAEVLYRSGHQAEITRKVSHIGGALVSYFLPLLVSLPTALAIGIFFCLF